MSDDFSVRAIFLHHKNDDVTNYNFNSFLKYNNKITAINDIDSSGISGSIGIPINNMPLERGNRYWNCDIPFLNYFIMNHGEFKDTHYLFCEWDCNCTGNINNELLKYKDNDATVPHIITQKSDPGWGHFNSLKNYNIPLIGFRPTSFNLFKKEALLKIVDKIISKWDIFKNANSECRLGTICEMCNLKYVEYDKQMSDNINHYPKKFKNNTIFNHPVKSVLWERYFYTKEIKYNKFVGSWEFGSIKDNKKYGILYLDEYGYIDVYENFNEVFWDIESNDNIIFYNGNGTITNRFYKNNGNIIVGDFWDGKKWNQEIHYIKKLGLRKTNER